MTCLCLRYLLYDDVGCRHVYSERSARRTLGTHNHVLAELAVAELTSDRAIYFERGAAFKLDVWWQ